MAKKKQATAKSKGNKSAGRAIPAKRLSATAVSPEDALTALIDILSSNPIWEKNGDVKILCKMVGAHIISLEADADELRANIDKALVALGCV